MTVSQIFFVSRNVEKLRDVLDVVGSWNDVRLDYFDYSIDELQTPKVVALVEAKALAAFKRVRHPVIVDHTCLGLTALNGLPGTMASAFWHAMGKDMCSMLEKLGNKTAEVSVCLGYSDGTRIIHVLQRQKGTIADAPRGARQFDWDRVFIPRGDSRTYAEMSLPEKNATSPRAKAFNKMILKIRKGR